MNLSARQLADPNLVGVVTDVLTRHGFDPALLTLEITETALMNNPDAGLATLTALKALGVSLAVDDFGTGYSSLTYLKRFPIDGLKIGRSFVAGLGTDHGDLAIVASCVVQHSRTCRRSEKSTWRRVRLQQGPGKSELIGDVAELAVRLL